MADKSELKLAEWSRWDGDGHVIIEDRVSGDDSVEIAVEDVWLWVGVTNCRPANALAAIRAVDGDPEYLELKRLRAENEVLRARCDALLQLGDACRGIVDE